MAATPPRPASPVCDRTGVASRTLHALQISPNLEALLEHDELTRRSTSSPTSTFQPTLPAGFPISLPPPPPRNAQGGRKREQEPIPTTRSKEAQRRKSATVGYDSWPDALASSSCLPDTTSTVHGSSSAPSRPVTPNPYINPTPVLRAINTPPPSHIDEITTPKQADRTFPNEPGADASRCSVDTRGRPSLVEPSPRPASALNKVEKILWMGRDSLNLFSGSASGLKRYDMDRRNDRAESGDFDAVQGNPNLSGCGGLGYRAVTLDRQIGQAPVAPTQTVPKSAYTIGDSDTATALSSRPGTSYLYALQQRSNAEPSETASTYSYSSYSESDLTRDPTPTPTPPRLAVHPLPHLSLPSITMHHNSSSESQPLNEVATHDYLSFIDFQSPSMVDDSVFWNFQPVSSRMSSSRRRPESIKIPHRSSLYSVSRRNHSSSSLASMKFAPPSPTSLNVHQPSPVYPHSPPSSTSTALSAMMFAPPSPSVERRLTPTWPQPFSGPSSPCSPLEFAPPPSPLQDVADRTPVPTASKLASENERGRKFKEQKRSMSSSPHPVRHLRSLPPTTNELDANERADRIRRNRKLARVFGRMPGTEEPVADVEEPRSSKKLHSPSLAALLSKQKNHRHAVSVSVSVKASGMKTEPSTPWQTNELWAPDGRRHSIPLTAASDVRGGRRHALPDTSDAASTRSFIDLSDEDMREDDTPSLTFLAPHCKDRRLYQSNSTPSLVESLDPEVQAEVEKRRKRERLARLHRFLGSRVPPEVVNSNVFGPPLPPTADPEEPNFEPWLRGDKNVEDEFDRGKEELDEKTKALNVRRAQKMERVFGTPPPQTLFHTLPNRPTTAASQPASPTSLNPYVLTLDIPSCSRNLNQSAYVGKTTHRRGPSDSSRCLLPHEHDPSTPSSFARSFADSLPESLSGFQEVLAQSTVYLNYQHSLNSLVDIIDRDDRKSLVELHRWLHAETDDSPAEEEVKGNPRRASNAPSFKSERRYSLPSNASMMSLSSEFCVPVQTSRFEDRRRKAAKLTNFFGVDYCELIRDILESIEKGVEEERKKGTLQPQEVEVRKSLRALWGEAHFECLQVLMHRVRSVRSLKDSLP
ncbi:hypothetical protein JVU11DRAFT_4781 [Chiua virens]|nr:hypothetical protein JVU11DRAFT_4781 [Chiua virens]